MEKILNSLKNYWFLIAALATLSAAWGSSQVKIQSLEEAVKQNSATQEEVVKLRAQSERIDERTKSIMESQARQERLIEAMLQSQRVQVLESKRIRTPTQQLDLKGKP